MDSRQSKIAIDLGSHVADELMVDMYRKINERLIGEDSAVKGATVAVAIGVLKGRIAAFLAGTEDMTEIMELVEQVFQHTIALYAAKKRGEGHAR